MKVVLASNTAWSLWNFRRGLMEALEKYGYEVYTVAPEDRYSAYLLEGFKFIPLKNLDRKGTNPLKDFKLFLEYLSIYRRIKPNLVLNYTIKPNIYSSLACYFLRIKCISTITGLGYVFIENTPLTKLVSFMYKLALYHNYKVLFQNNDDMKLFLERKIVDKDKAIRIKGSGVNTLFFNPEICKDYPKNKSFVFLMVSRLLWDKGVREYIEAGRILKRIYGEKVEIWILGSVDKGNPSVVSEEDLKKWTEEGIVKYLGVAEDVRPYICQADCVVLPSYREGIPRSLLEAMAMEKPIITTDSPGCRDVCADGENGFLVKPKDVESLFVAMKRMLELSEEERLRMGKRGRKMVLDEFSEEKL
ncbi:MAG: glycosyltransferase family 4 protein [Aquificaceae bacterium]|nr:glycosyltransferase family 4 protein [Aquificaceae bacterium]